MRWICGQFAIVLAGVLLTQAQTSTSSEPQVAASGLQAAPSQTDKQTANSQPVGEAADVEKQSNHKWHVNLGTVSVGASYTYISAPFFDPFYPFYPFAFSSPGLLYPGYFYAPYGPFYGNYLPGLAYADDKGRVELSVVPKSADVYLDGAYAGTAGNLKKIWLTPGAYDLAVSTPGGASFHERIYVLSGKSVKVKHNLLSQNVQEKQ